MMHTSRASPTPAHAHTGQAQCWGGGGQGVKCSAPLPTLACPLRPLQPYSLEPADSQSCPGLLLFPHPLIHEYLLDPYTTSFPGCEACSLCSSGKGPLRGRARGSMPVLGAGRGGQWTGAGWGLQVWALLPAPRDNLGTTYTLPWYDQARDPMAGSLSPISPSSCSHSR